MTPANVQELLAAAGYYNAAIDGIIGDKSRRAVDSLLTKHYALLPKNNGVWTLQRKLVAAGQIILRFAQYEPGAIDGLVGNNTRNAFMAWRHQQAYKRPLELDRTPIRPATGKSTIFPRQVDCAAFYGKPGTSEITSRLVTVHVPYVLRIDYDLSQTTQKVTLHEKCAESAELAYREIHKAYGYRINPLGLDLYAGSYNPRKMRGGTAWSMHAYGCASDFGSARNGLTTRCPQAQFCASDYNDFFDIWEAYGWVSLGREIGRDWMHIQAARL